LTKRFLPAPEQRLMQSARHPGAVFLLQTLRYARPKPRTSPFLTLLRQIRPAAILLVLHTLASTLH
jgi:hypothetical protein